MNQSFSSIEKLKSKKHIDALFDNGKSINAFPIKLVYRKYDFEDDTPFKIGVSASKRHFKNAVDRNHVKRLLREGYRLNKHLLLDNITQKYVFMFLFLDKDIPNFNTVNAKMEQVLTKFIAKETVL